MLDAFLTENNWRKWSQGLTLREYSPNGLLQRCDLFLADPRAPSLLLLVDGSSSSGSSVPISPRSRLFGALAREWLSWKTLAPGELLARLSENLRSANIGSAKRMFASAVCLRPGARRGDWELAEAGDCKTFLYDGMVGNVVLPDGLPRPDHRVEGLLGIGQPHIRTAAVRPESGQRLLVATDGAFHALTQAGIADVTGKLSGNVLAAFDACGSQTDDDATLALVESHIWWRHVL